MNFTDIPHQLIYDSLAQSIFSDSQYSFKYPRLTNYAYFMEKKLKATHTEDTKNEGEIINADNQEDIKIDEDQEKKSGEHLIALNLIKDQLNLWNQTGEESQLKPPYVWLPSKTLDRSENKPMKRKRSKPKGNGNLLFMLASKPEKCHSFVQQKSLKNQTLVSDDKIKRNEQLDISEEVPCMPRWMISCHISDKALRARLVPLARAQIRRHIRQGSLILCPDISNVELNSRSEKQITDNKVSLTKLPKDGYDFYGDDRQIPFTRELVIPNQKLISLNESLKMNTVSLDQHQHTKPYFLNELLKYQRSGHDKRKVADSPIQEQDELKAKSHLLADLLPFEQSKLETFKPTTHYTTSSIDNILSFYMNRCYTSPINWSSSLHNNSELKETSYELFPLSSSQENYSDDVIQPKNLIEKQNSLSHINGSIEDCSTSVAVWQTMPGRILRRQKTHHVSNKNQQLKNDQLCSNDSKQTMDELKLNLKIENVSNVYNKMNVNNDTSEVQLSRPTEDKYERNSDGTSSNRFNNSYWSSRRHPGYIERLYTIGSVSCRKNLYQDNESQNNFKRNYVYPEKYKFLNSVDLITLKPKVKSFLPQIRDSFSKEKHWHRNMLKSNSFDKTAQDHHFGSLPMLIKPPPPSPDVRLYISDEIFDKI
ncbi:unnamed protein product [Schistosoma turkestanicum]|nr:unnamed protein product [Schistosoma turkestanicum]